MINSCINYLKKIYKWYEKNIAKVIFVVVTYMVFDTLFHLPYINLLQIVFGFLPILISWIVALILFRPPKNAILTFSLLAFAPSIIFNSISNLVPVAEFLGNISYFALITYVLSSLSEIRVK